MKIEILPFDPKTASRNEWARYHAFRRLRHEETDPEDPLLEEKTREKLMKRPDPQSEEYRFTLIDGTRPDVQIGSLEFDVFKKGSPTYETNKHLAWVNMEVLKPYRRKGIGRRLLAKVAQLVREHDRSLIVSYCDEDDGKGFIEAIGAQLASKRRENRLHLDQVDWRMVERWAEEGPSRSPDTKLQWLTNRIDDDILEDFCKVMTEVVNQQPFDDLEVNDFINTPESRREGEARIANVGGSIITALTREADGDISGLTEMFYLPDDKTLIGQGMTGVRERYRGRGLGKWLKAEMLLRVRREFPQVKTVATGNASSNEAMLSINERLGFKTHKDALMAQMTIKSLEDYLGKK